jgi:membrane-associated protease RseP (regulator of RpoE activity)
MSVKHGVLVVHVYPDSPAVKADVKADDILLQAGDAKIETGPDLVKAIDAAKETEMSFLVLREGKEQKVTIAPKKREDATKTLGLYEKRHTDAFPQHSEKVQEVTKQLRPGAFLSRATTAKMPDDVTIQITKEGNKPAKVQVKKGDKSWEATADKLDSLPADIRPHVEQLMSGAGQGVLTLTAPTIEAREPSAFRM